MVLERSYLAIIPKTSHDSWEGAFSAYFPSSLIGIIIIFFHPRRRHPQEMKS